MKFSEGNLEMKVSIIMMFLVLFLGGCGKQSAAEREALDRAKPGSQEAKSFCSQCHTLPFAGSASTRRMAICRVAHGRLYGISPQADAKSGRT